MLWLLKSLLFKCLIVKAWFSEKNPSLSFSTTLSGPIPVKLLFGVPDIETWALSKTAARCWDQITRVPDWRGAIIKEDKIPPRHHGHCGLENGCQCHCHPFLHRCHLFGLSVPYGKSEAGAKSDSASRAKESAYLAFLELTLEWFTRVDVLTVGVAQA